MLRVVEICFKGRVYYSVEESDESVITLSSSLYKNFGCSVDAIDEIAFILWQYVTIILS